MWGLPVYIHSKVSWMDRQGMSVSEEGGDLQRLAHEGSLAGCLREEGTPSGWPGSGLRLATRSFALAAAASSASSSSTLCSPPAIQRSVLVSHLLRIDHQAGSASGLHRTSERSKLDWLPSAQAASQFHRTSQRNPEF